MHTDSSSASARSQGFTLVELMAVIIVIAIATSLAAVSVARADRAGVMQSAIWQLSCLNTEARVTARAGDRSIAIRVKHDGHEVVLVGLIDSARHVASFQLPKSVSIQLLAQENNFARPVRQLLIDRRGQSADAIIEISSSESHTRRLLLHGLTGHLVRIDEVGGGAGQ